MKEYRSCLFGCDPAGKACTLLSQFFTSQQYIIPHAQIRQSRHRFQEFPDEVTLAINLSLCPNGCPGCHSAYLQGNVGDELTEERLRAILDNYIGEITCVGFMGGDNDPTRVMQLARMVQETYAGKLHTGWYSGHSKLPEGFQPEALNYVKLGPYRADSGPLKERTTNQRLYRIRHEAVESGKYLEDITHRFWR